MKKPETNNPNTISNYEVNRKIRKDWGNINPVTRRIESKKKDYRVKHKGKEFDYDY